MEDKMKIQERIDLMNSARQEKIYSIEQLKEIDKLYLEKCEEVNRLKAYIQKLEKEK